jgi:hypothetical protein
MKDGVFKELNYFLRGANVPDETKPRVSEFLKTMADYLG